MKNKTHSQNVNFKRVAALAIALSIWGISPITSATSVRQLSFEQMCSQARFIFEGQAVAVEVRSDSSANNFSTYVTFEVLHVIKGVNDSATFELRFFGGTKDGNKVTLSDMRIPEVGEIGVYFVQSRDQNFAHPLVGWSQGHFIEQFDNSGKAGIYSVEKRAVKQVTPEKLHHAVATESGKQRIVSGLGSVSNLELEQMKAVSGSAIDVRSFKELILDQVEQSGEEKQ